MRGAFTGYVERVSFRVCALVECRSGMYYSYIIVGLYYYIIEVGCVSG